MARKPKSDTEVVSTRLRMPAGLHRMLTATAERNSRSLNSEILWCIAKQLGDEATKHVEAMSVEQRRSLSKAFETLLSDPERLEKVVAALNLAEKGKG